MALSPHHDAENAPAQLGESNKVATFGSRQLNIVWGNDPRYWKIPQKGGDTANAPAELLQVCWLEVSGSVSISGATKGSKYKISFTVSLKPDAFGWNNCPVYVMAKFGKKGKYSWMKKLLQASELEKVQIGDLDIEYSGNSSLNSSDETIYFGLYEVWSGKWKGGLLLYSATVQQVA